MSKSFVEFDNINKAISYIVIKPVIMFDSKSFTYELKKSGQRTAPWGTPRYS